MLISIAPSYLSSNKLVQHFCWRWGEVEPSTKFSKRRGLTGSQSSDLRISAEKDRGDFSRRVRGGGGGGGGWGGGGGGGWGRGVGVGVAVFT